MHKAPALVIIGGTFFLLGAFWVRGHRDRAKSAVPEPRPDAKVSIERFSEGSLDSGHWFPFRAGEFRQSVIEANGSLCLAADTRGTPPGTWQHLGVRRAAPIPIREGTEISVNLDWVERGDTTFFSASIILSPHSDVGNPRDSSDWIEVSYLGVSPGADARMAVATRARGEERAVFSDGFPELNATGRSISRQNIKLRFRNDGFEVYENGRLMCRSDAGAIIFDPAYLHLVLSSESNFGLRQVHFDDVEIRAR